jgi:hypothetical protein
MRLSEGLPDIHPGALPRLQFLAIRPGWLQAALPASWGGSPGVLPELRDLSLRLHLLGGLPPQWAAGLRRLGALAVTDPWSEPGGEQLAAAPAATATFIPSAAVAVDCCCCCCCWAGPPCCMGIRLPSPRLAGFIIASWGLISQGMGAGRLPSAHLAVSMRLPVPPPPTCLPVCQPRPQPSSGVAYLMLAGPQGPCLPQHHQPTQCLSGC